MSLEPWHAVIALGTDGGQPLADGDELARGVHLLWTLRPELGFPAEGYDVFRRRHRPPEWGCLDPPNGLLPPKGRTQWSSSTRISRSRGTGCASTPTRARRPVPPTSSARAASP